MNDPPTIGAFLPYARSFAKVEAIAYSVLYLIVIYLYNIAICSLLIERILLKSVFFVTSLKAPILRGMNEYENSHNIQFALKNSGRLRFEQDQDYQEVISPFTRLYMVHEGYGWIKTEGEKIILEPGFLYLIPSLRSCSYHFSKDMLHRYVHFSMSLQNGLPVYTIFDTLRKVKTEALSESLFKRLIAIHPEASIPHLDPDVYQSKAWLHKKLPSRSIATHIETCGILNQLFSRFVMENHQQSVQDLVKHKLYKVLAYIANNMDKPIAVEELSSISCLSKDHFIRVFKKATAQTPADYINAKRVERAQMLLLTTDYPMKYIIEKTGFASQAYFSRMFKKYCAYSPSEYRRFRQ